MKEIHFEIKCCVLQKHHSTQIRIKYITTSNNTNTQNQSHKICTFCLENASQTLIAFKQFQLHVCEN